MPPRIAIDILPVPATLEEPGGADFSAVRGLFRAASEEELGHSELISSDRVELARAQPSPYGRRAIFVARSTGGSGDVVGAAVAELPLSENRGSADVELVVDPGWRRRDIGSRLLERVADYARADGRPTLNGWANVAAPAPAGNGAAPRTISPARGEGSVPADTASSAFALAHGFELGQVERGSSLDVSAASSPVLDRLEAEALGAAAGYSTLEWVGPVPGWAVGDYCRIIERMDTDPPMAGMAYEPSHWDEERLRTAEARRQRQGATSVVTVARDEGTGRLVAYTELVVFADQGGVAFQEGTLVLPEHRGHRLGQLVKAGNQRLLVRTLPAVHRIYTWNAAENSHMLRINEALGLRQAHLEAAWTRT